MRRLALPAALLALLTQFAAGATPRLQSRHPPPRIDGELKAWHRVSLTFEGPRTNERATPNPFRDHRLDVTFTDAVTGEARRVPGFFAADGRAAETSATAGTAWRVHFAPPRAGAWRWRVSFRTGPDVAIADDPGAGEPWSRLDGQSGTLRIEPTDKSAPDFRARGALEYVGERYLRFAGDASWFLKGGVGSPETMLAYADFDDTYRDLRTDGRPPAPNDPIPLPALRDGLLRFEPHLPDWRAGDPAWQNGKGKALIGGLNYLAGQGVNSVYFLTMNVNGDGRNVWPWVDPRVRDRYDVSKLEQWEVVFTHMTRLGLMLHVVTQETENDHLLDRGDLGPERKLYYRELVARFAHHPAITWNIGEENVQSVAQQQAAMSWLRALNPYRQHIVIHNDHWHAKNLRDTFTPLLGFAPLTGTALQDFYWNDVHAHVLRFVRASRAAQHPWVVSADELGGANFGTLPDADDPEHDDPRRFGLWGTLMAGGGGVEWYFGWQNNSPNSDLSSQDWRTREAIYRQTRIALGFFHEHLPFHRMEPGEEWIVGDGVFGLAAPGEVYALYLPNGGGTRFELAPEAAAYEVKWFDPRRGGPLRDGTVRRVRGPGLAWTGWPPEATSQDWVALVRRVAAAAPVTSAAGRPDEAAPEDLGIDPAGMQHALNYWRMHAGTDGVSGVVIARRGRVVHRGARAATAADVLSLTQTVAGALAGILASSAAVTLPRDAAWRGAFGERLECTDAERRFSRIATQAAGRDLLAVARERLFEPIGVAIAEWAAEGAIDGIPIRNGCTGLRIDALGLARIGDLFLNDGRWHDREVVPSTWIRESARAGGRDGERLLPDAPAGTYFAAGADHNLLVVIPEWEMVVARTGSDGVPPGGNAQTLNAFLRRLGLAVYPLERARRSGDGRRR